MYKLFYVECGEGIPLYAKKEIHDSFVKVIEDFRSYCFLIGREREYAKTFGYFYCGKVEVYRGNKLIASC